MTNASSSNMQHSDTALLTEPQKKRHYDTNDERVFLAQQAADAKTAMQHTIADMQATAKEAANITVDTAIPMVCSGRGDSPRVCCHDICSGTADHRTPSAPPAANQAARPSWTASLFEMVRSMLMSVIIGALHPKDQQSGRCRLPELMPA